jgi:outer membrane protein
MNVRLTNRCAIALFATSVSSYAHAAGGAAENDSSAFQNTWQFTLGMGAMTTPEYPGASDRKYRLAPVGGATYGRFFFGASDAAPTVPFGVGIIFYKDTHWTAGAAVSYDIFSPRKESDDESALHGLGDIKRTAHVNLFGRYTRDWYSFSASVKTDVAGQHEGTQIRLGADGKFPITKQIILTAGPSITWSSSAYNQTFFGVNSTQSLSSGKSAYAPGAGISNIDFSVGAVYLLTKKWTLGAQLSAGYLPTRVSNSPVVGSKAQFNAGLFGSYHF